MLMKRLLPLFLGFGLLACAAAGRAASAYPEPPGGWTYILNGDQRVVGDATTFSWLDGTWSHNNGSDEFDGSEIGGTFSDSNKPGGVSLLNQDGTSFLRLQDPGDPRDYGHPDPGSNRKVYFGHDISQDTDPETAALMLDNGATITFRARIPTAAKGSMDGEFLIDPLMRDGQQGAGIQPYPEEGDGYVTSDGGKGNFVIRPLADPPIPGGAIAFSLTQITDTAGGDPNGTKANFAGLTVNEKAGNAVSGNVDFNEGTGTNVLAFDPTDWHELYIVIQKDPANITTHEAFVFLDGSLSPVVFKMTAGNGKDVEVDSYLALGGSATPQSWALDVDWFGFKDEAVFPPGSIDNIPPTILDVSIPPNTMFHPAASGLSFKATTQAASTNNLPAEGFSLVLNDQDLSAGLVVTGPEKDRSVTYNALEPNRFYQGQIIVADQAGRKATNDLSFDTFVEAAGVAIESEDYNHGNGQFIDDPAPGAYATLVGTAGVDFFDLTSDQNVYRGDAVDGATSTDTARQKFTDSGQVDYVVSGVQQGEWLNYTRSYQTAGRYLVYMRNSSTMDQLLRVDKVTGATTANQALSGVGTFRVRRSGNLNLYQWTPMTDAFGNPLSVSLSGQQTLRLTAVGANNDLQHNLLFVLPDPDAASAAIAVASAFPAPDQVNVRAGSTLQVALADGVNAVNPATVKLWFDGVSVSPTVADTAEGVLVTYDLGLLEGQRVYSLQIEFADAGATPNVVTESWSFTTAGYANVPPELATPIGTGADPGMKWRTHQLESGNTSSIALAEQQLAGTLGPSVHVSDDYPLTGAWVGPQGADGFFVMNYLNLELDGNAAGNFSADAAGVQNVADDYIPGVNTQIRPGDNVAVECFAYLEFPEAGLYEMVVNSDDGFLVSTGNRASPTFLTLGSFDAGRSATDSVFQLGIEQPGVYLVRLLWFQGTGGASVEWFTVNSDGSRALINGTQPGAIRAFQRRTVAEPDLPATPVDVPMEVALDSGTGEVVITWDATVQSLQESTDLQNWNNVTGSSPFRAMPAGPAKYYRLLVSP